MLHRRPGAGSHRRAPARPLSGRRLCEESPELEFRGPRARSLRVSLYAAALAVPALVVVQPGIVGAAPVVPAVRSALLRPMTATLAARLSRNVDRHVIVMLKSQLAAAHVGSRACGAALRCHRRLPGPAHERASRGARHARQELPAGRLFRRHGVAGEEAWLKADPAVAEVIPDVTISAAQPIGWPDSGRVLGVAEVVAAERRPLTPNVIPGACGPNGAGSARSGGPGADEHRLGHPGARPRARWASRGRA